MTLQSYYTRLLKNIHFLLFCMLMTAFPPYSNGIIQHTEEKEEFMLMLLACLCTYALVGTCGGQKWVLGIFLNHSLLYVLRQSLNLELTNSARLAHWPRPGVCLCLSPPPTMLGLQMYAVAFGFSRGCWGLNSDPHACMTSILPTQPSCYSRE